MSALYKSGTVTVTNGSNIVTGTGTSFISIAGIVPGALFTINGANWYEVYEVDTNTQIKVRTIPAGQAYQQVTASGQTYAIFQNFTSLSPTEIAARVVAIQQKWHIREEEMTDWFASTNDFEEITNINGDKITVMTPFGVNNLLGTAATKNVGTASGNLMEVGAFGLGATNPPNLNPYKPADVSGWKTGFVRINAGLLSTGEDFLGDGNVYGGGISLSYDGGGKSLFMCDGVDDEWYGYSYRASTGWSETVKFYHSGNTNFNEFGGVAANDWLMEGEIVSSTGFCTFSAPINSPTPVTGSSTTGQFSILNRLTGAVIASGVTSFIASSTSSNKLLRLTYTLPTGSYQAGTPLVIATETASSKITVNF